MIKSKISLFFDFFYKKNEEQKEGKHKKKSKYILDRSINKEENIKDSLKFKIHLQKSESQREESIETPFLEE